MNRLIIQNLHHRFGLVEVLSDININLAPPETLAIVGPSGCGKSTLINLIAGLLPLEQGQIQQPYKPIAYMFQNPGLLPWKNGFDNLDLVLRARRIPKEQRHARIRRYAHALRLDPADLNKYPHELSGGMQSRFALARALIIDPQLLLLDEPFSALDIGLKLQLYALLRHFIEAQKMAVIMITHDLMEAVRLADRILLMAAAPGRIVAEHHLPRTQSQRNDDWVYRETAKLIQQPLFQQSFQIEPGAPAVEERHD